MLKKFVFKKISTIEIPKSSKLHRYVNKVRKLYHARYKIITIGHIDECHYVSTTALQSNASISMCNELTNDTQSSLNKHFIMSIYAVCFSVIKSCTCWDSSTLQALHEHVCLFYEKCNVDRVGKMPSNITIYDAEIKIKYSDLN